MRILVYEPDHTGHHFAYLAPLLPALADLGAQVTLATTAAALKSDPYRIFIGPLESRVSVDGWMDPLPKGSMQIARAKYRGLLESLRRSGAAYGCIPYADGLAQVMGMVRLRAGRAMPAAVEAAGLMMRGAFAYPLPGLKRRLKAELSWSLATRAPLDPLFILDPLVFEAVRRRGGEAAGRAILMPETVEAPSALDRSAARRRLGIPEDGRYLGCAGLIDPRKGADRLIHAFAGAELGATDRLLLVGEHDPAVRALLSGPYAGLVSQGRIISVDRFVELDELGAALRAMDVVCAPHHRHIGSASLVVRAAAAERRVVGGRFGWVGWAVDKFGLGLTCDAENPESLGRALRQALDGAATFTLTPIARRWLRFNSSENFAAVWAKPIRDRMGLADTAPLRTWEWVERDE